MKQTHDDITEAKEVYIQHYFGRYKGKLVLRNESPSIYSYFHCNKTKLFCQFWDWDIFKRF